MLFAVLFAASAAFGMTYFHMDVDGATSTVQTQGQMQFLMADCDSSGSIDVSYYMDFDSSGTVDAGEPEVFEMYFEDNETEFPPDMNPAAGIMEIFWPLHMLPGHYVVRGSDDTDELEFPYHVLAPDPLLMTVSGRITFEGITPPDSSLAYFSFLVGTMDPPLIMYVYTDEWGDYSVNWPGDADTVMAMFMDDVPGYETPDMPIYYVDGHVTGFDIEFLLGGSTGLSDVRMFVEGSESYTQTQGEDYSFGMNSEEWGSVDIAFYVDSDASGTLEFGEPNFFDRTWHVYDNGWTGEWCDDMNDTEGYIGIGVPFNFPPGSYIFWVSDGTTTEEVAFTVLAPSPLTMSISGTVSLEGITAPNPLLEKIVMKAQSTMLMGVSYFAYCDDMGDYTCNWASGMDNVVITFMPPFVSDSFDFASEMLNVDVDGFETGADFYLSSSSILVIFEADSGGWEINQDEIEAIYIDPITREAFDTIRFPHSGDIYIPVPVDSCGIVFRATDTVHFYDHNFISPFDTLWISADDYPTTYDVYADQCNYHFLLYFDDFELDSVPTEGIRVELYGEDSLGHEYYTDFHVFIELYDSVYLVASERELCDADWRLKIPALLPGNYIPAVTGTTFYIPEVPDWPWFAMHIPVSFTNVAEAKLPGMMDIGLYPNPFNGAVAVDFDIDEPGRVTLDVYDVMGKRVNTLIDGNISGGVHRAFWNATSGEGQAVPSGVYFFRLSTQGETRITKGLYIR